MSWNFFTNTGSLKTNTVTSATMPAGTIMGYAGATAPLGFLFCDATAVSRAGYPQLFSAIGTTFGVGDGTTTFNLPDLRGRSIVGLGTNAAVNALALSDGVTTVANRRPQHRHTTHTHASGASRDFALTDGTTMGAPVGGSVYQTGSKTTNIASVDGGTGNANDSLDAPAFLVTNYIISTTTVAPVVASNVTAYGGSVASASSIAVTGNSTYLLTGTTGVSTVTGGVTGNSLTILASGQATGVCVVLNHAATSNALSLRDSANLGIYAGESLTFVYDGTKWVEIARNLNNQLAYAEKLTTTSITTTTANGADVATTSAVTMDGSTAIIAVMWTDGLARGSNWVQPIFAVDGTAVYSGGYQTSTNTGPATTIFRYTPTAGSHTFGFRAKVDAGTGSVGANSGPPNSIRISRAI